MHYLVTAVSVQPHRLKFFILRSFSQRNSDLADHKPNPPFVVIIVVTIIILSPDKEECNLFHRNNQKISERGLHNPNMPPYR